MGLTRGCRCRWCKCTTTFSALPGDFCFEFFVVKSPKIPVLHQHYLPHFGAYVYWVCTNRKYEIVWDGMNIRIRRDTLPYKSQENNSIILISILKSIYSCLLPLSCYLFFSCSKFQKIYICLKLR